MEVRWESRFRWTRRSIWLDSGDEEGWRRLLLWQERRAERFLWSRGEDVGFLIFGVRWGDMRHGSVRYSSVCNPDKTVIATGQACPRHSTSPLAPYVPIPTYPPSVASTTPEPLAVSSSPSQGLPALSRLFFDFLPPLLLPAPLWLPPPALVADFLLLPAPRPGPYFSAGAPFRPCYVPPPPPSLPLFGSPPRLA